MPIFFGVVVLGVVEVFSIMPSDEDLDFLQLCWYNDRYNDGMMH